MKSLRSSSFKNLYHQTQGQIQGRQQVDCLPQVQAAKSIKTGGKCIITEIDKYPWVLRKGTKLSTRGYLCVVWGTYKYPPSTPA